MNSMPDNTHYDPSLDLEAMEDLPNYYGAMMGYFRPYLRGEGIEIGAGRGEVSERIQSALDRLELVEPAANLASTLKQRFKNKPHVSIIPHTFEEQAAKFPQGCRDTIVLINVLEHIEDDDLTLAEIFRVLRPGGHLLLFVPALPFLFSKLDAAIGHYRRYRLADLRRQVKAAGFEITASRYFDILGVLPWLLINTWGGKVKLTPGMVRIYDSYMFPLSNALDTLIEPPFGKNIIMVARRPGD